MDISTIGNLGSTLEASKSSGKVDQTMFLNLLMKQLQYQDPLNPMDNTEFTSQLAQFSSLEELNDINGTLEDVLAFQQSMQNASVADLIGKTVQVEGNSVHLTETAQINYALPGDASSLEISIYDSTGQLVWNENMGYQKSGNQRYEWDGKDLEGNRLPEGSYSFSIEAMDLSGNPVSPQTSSQGRVTEVLFEDGLTFIMLDGNRKVNLSDIKSIG